jgi:hypothetical protein
MISPRWLGSSYITAVLEQVQTWPRRKKLYLLALSSKPVSPAQRCYRLSRWFDINKLNNHLLEGWESYLIKM